MNAVINWIKNNLVTVVEVVAVVVDAAEILVNGIARFFLPTDKVKMIHDALKLADEWLVKIKGFLVKTAG